MSAGWLWWTIPLAVLGLLGVGVAVRSLIALGSSRIAATEGIADEQTLILDTTGPMLLHGEGPRFTTAFGAMEFQLIREADGARIPLKSVLIKSSSAGLRLVTLSLRRFEIETPGPHRLLVSGAPAADARVDHRLFVTQDHRGRLGGVVVGLVLSGIATLGGIGLSLAAWLVGRAGT